MFECGRDITNWFDNMEDQNDIIILNLLAFVSNDGDSFNARQVHSECIIMSGICITSSLTGRE